MNPSRYEAALNGQSAIARKVFQMVPIQEAWTVDQIIGELIRVTHTRMEIKSVHTCLGRLKDAGLIREKDRGRFQRIDVKEPSVAVVSLEVVSPTAPALVEETAAPSRRPFDILADAAAALNLLAEQIRNTAGELETAALEIENEFAKESEALEKLKQFQTLLKSLT